MTGVELGRCRAIRKDVPEAGMAAHGSEATGGACNTPPSASGMAHNPREQLQWQLQHAMHPAEAQGSPAASSSASPTGDQYREQAVGVSLLHLAWPGPRHGVKPEVQHARAMNETSAHPAMARRKRSR
ncbi:unnamed protein product [Symbiodinium sp. CCMP2592]|nr:unnamed protein product [Symbiodinium sp. CCMP2592]